MGNIVDETVHLATGFSVLPSAGGAPGVDLMLETPTSKHRTLLRIRDKTLTLHLIQKLQEQVVEVWPDIE